MEELKKEKKKHNHKATDLLKVSIFCILMLAPFLAIGVNCAYVVFNKNAKDSYNGNYEYLTTTNYNTYITNKKIPFVSYTDGQYTNYTLTSTSFNNIEINRTASTVNETIYLIGINTNKIVINGTEYNNIQSAIFGQTDRDQFYFATYNVTINNNYFIQKTAWNNAELYNQNTKIEKINYGITNNFVNNITLNASLVSNVIYSSSNVTSGVLSYSTLDIYVNDTTLSNVFYSSVSRLQQANLFNWAKTTGIYTPINAMTSGLGIKDNTIPMLLAYWSILTAIYIVFDLIIWVFTKITHLINAD